VIATAILTLFLSTATWLWDEFTGAARPKLLEVVHRVPGLYWAVVGLILILVFVVEGALKWIHELEEEMDDRGSDHDATKQHLRELNAELERERDNNKPKLRLTITGVQTAECENPKDSLFQISMSIENTGAPSIVKKLSASFQVDGQPVQTKLLLAPVGDIKSTLPDGMFMEFKKADYLPIKAYASAIQTGAGVLGWFHVVIKNVDTTTAWKRGTLTVSCCDVIDQPYSASLSPNGVASTELLTIDNVKQREKPKTWTGDMFKRPS
jgi:hypothetical protein